MFSLTKRVSPTLAVARASVHELEDFQLAAGDVQAFAGGVVGGELGCGGDLRTLRERTFYGKEKKSLAYVIAIMSMILPGIKTPTLVTHQHLHGKSRGHSGERSLRLVMTDSALLRKGTRGGAA